MKRSKAIKRNFLSGLAILLPMVVSIVIIVFLVNLFTKPFLGFVEEILQNLGFGKRFLVTTAKILILVTFVLLTFIVGIFTRLFFLHYLFRLGDKIIHRIPIINNIYRAVQDVVHTLFSTEKGDFSQVVLVPYPYNGVYSLGMITSEALTEDEERVSVFVPATPNPTMGFMLMFKRSQLIFIDMKVEDALKAIISCGVVFKNMDQTNETKSSLSPG